ncbi:MFS transporter [Arthrobacter sp. NQ4]|uniref:MFS transporter n=1 Tax=Arthrobacter sp. NQ4 TaxID=3027930 RepID=UPI0023B0BE88|nr:MFS transporter [Arthrobacter sp. NQ4]MDE8585966.1 MFS transporter [Arthrobacter sp. NQ4]
MSTFNTTAAASAEQSTLRAGARTVFGIGVGNALEWFDWAIYASFAPFFAGQVFDNKDPVSAMLATLAVFAVGFVARPVGGFFFGWLADRKGRKFAMTLSVGLASLGSLMLALTPTFAAVGVFASILLLLTRLIQGLAHGGEMPAAQTYVAEVAPRERRGLWASLIYFSGTCGILFGMLLGAVLTVVLPQADMLAWGWRVPFALGAVFGLYALFMRSRMKETSAFEAASEPAGVPRDSLWQQMLRARKQSFQVIGMTLGLTVCYYSWAVTAPVQAVTLHGMDRGTALWASVAANAVFIAVLPLWGILSDRIGRKPVMLIGGIGAAVLYFPMQGMIGQDFWSLAIPSAVELSFLAAGAAISPAVYAELFPTRVRTLGVAVPYAFVVALFGGTAPYLQTLFASLAMPAAFGIYAVVLLVISLLVILRLPETRGIRL